MGADGLVKDIILIGGPNGAGKTTLAYELLPLRLGLLDFVNADNIAQGLSPFDVDRAAVLAGRIMIDRMRELVHVGRSFAFETTCSGRGHAGFLARCRADGWRVTVIYLWLDDPELAVARVARRVARGGHDVPRDVIVRRYWAGLRNVFGMYLPLADVAWIYDNSHGSSRVIASHTRDDGWAISDAPRWRRLKESVRAELD